jgi:hypothetical protein
MNRHALRGALLGAWLLTAVPAFAQTAWDAAYDPAAQARFIPVELWTAATAATASTK